MQSDEMQIIQVALDAPHVDAEPRRGSPNAVKQLSKLMSTLSSRSKDGDGEADADILHSIYGLATKASIKHSNT